MGTIGMSCRILVNGCSKVSLSAVIGNWRGGQVKNGDCWNELQDFS